MSTFEIAAILAAGVAAGAINSIVGSGTLITFPVLLAFGYAPVVANVSNNLGLVPGALAAAYGYRSELAGQRSRVTRYGLASLGGGSAGAAALLLAPESAFRAIVPAFIAGALILVVLQPRLARRLDRRDVRRAPEGGRLSVAAVAGSGVYGGYFGGAQGILLLSILGLALDDELQRINALKIVLAGLVNLVAGAIFLLAATVAWEPALLIAVGSTLGGRLGAGVGRRLSPALLRAVIVLVGLAAIVKLLTD